jgi:hypothetical protein
MIKLKDLIKEDFKTQAKKFIESGVDADIVGDYIKKFKKIRDAKFKVALDGEIAGFHINGNDRFNIDKYKTFKELEVFVDYVDGQVKLSNSKGKTFTDIDVSGEALGKKNGLEIYYAKDREACVRYRGGKPHGWCVARSDAGNMYNYYRNAGNEPSFYFVKDVAAMEEEFRKPFDPDVGFTNKWHFFVIQKTRNGYIVTSANNDGDVDMTWDEILKIEPKLNGMEEYFKHVPLTDREREVYTRFKNGIPFNEFVKLSYEEKESYLDIAGVKGITYEFFAVLPRDLKNKYIGFGLGLDKDQVAEISNDPKLMQWMNQKSFERHKSRVDGTWIKLLFSDDYYYENNEEKFIELLGSNNNSINGTSIITLILYYAKDKDKYVDKIIKFKGKDLSDDNISDILKHAEDKDKCIDKIIKFKGKDLSDENIDQILYAVKDKDKYIDWAINVKGNNLSFYALDLIRKYKNNFPSKLTQENISIFKDFFQ